MFSGRQEGRSLPDKTMKKEQNTVVIHPTPNTQQPRFIEPPADREVFTPGAIPTSATCEAVEDGYLKVTTYFDKGEPSVVHVAPDSEEWTSKKKMSLRDAIRAVGSEGDLAASYTR